MTRVFNNKLVSDEKGLRKKRIEQIKGVGGGGEEKRIKQKLRTERVCVWVSEKCKKEK